jgi:predicted metallo-beta-lactamase superfamily hydrolase
MKASQGQMTRPFLNGRHRRRILLTHDVSTITHYAYDRVRSGRPIPGIFEVSRDIPINILIDDILLLAEYSVDGEWEGQVRYLPLR